MKRLLLALVAGAIVFTLAFASAAALNVNGNVVQAGVDGDLRCDTTGVDAGYGLETTDNTVRYVRIENIADACVGADLFVKINEATGDAEGPFTITENGSGTDDNFVKVPFASPYPAPENITSLRVWIEG